MTHTTPTEADIIAYEERFLAAMRAMDAAQLEAFLSDDLTFVGPMGDMATKQMDVANYQSGGMKVTELKPLEREIRCLDGAGVAITKVFLSGAFQGNEFAGHYRYLRVWQHTEQGWQIFAGSVTPILSQ